MERKAISLILLALILVGMLNVPPTTVEVGVDAPKKQNFNGDDSEPFSVGEDPWNSSNIIEVGVDDPQNQNFNGDNMESFSVSEDLWDFSNIIEWSRFAYVNDNSAEVVIGLSNTQTEGCDRLSNLTYKSGGAIVNTVSMGGKTVALVVNMSVETAPSFVESVRATGLTKYVEPNMRFHTQLTPNDPHWSSQWGPRKIEADDAWDTTVGAPSVLVAVIDTGIDYNHPDLVDNYVALGYDWVNNDADPMDDHGHGTHCAGIIAATINNNIGIAGVAQVRIMAEKGLGSGGSGSASDLANAIIHAVDQGADILSNSWGGWSDSSLIHDAVEYAQDRGVLVLAAAGNEAVSMKLYPAAYDEVVAVTATDQSDEPAYFTSYGKWVDVAAPGVDIYSTYLNNGYEYKSGTSMACPHVAGVAALIWSEFPSLTRGEVRLRLRLTADDLGDPGFDVYYGYGRVNARGAVERPSHDLLILDWKRPAYVEPGSSGVINTTVVNFGGSNEAGITVQLRVNGSVVESAYISYLEFMKSATVSCMWNPTVEGRYYVESYVVPVAGETVVENNVRSAYINVRIGKFIRIPEDCSTIQEAVDLASLGETIKVASGIYYEHVGIDTSLKLVGEDRNTTVIDGNQTGAVVEVTADNVVVKEFTVQNSGQGQYYHGFPFLGSLGGIVLLGVRNCEVTNNTLINNFNGVLLRECNGNNSVCGNIVFSSVDAGIGSEDSTVSDTIRDNVITGGIFGIAIVHARARISHNVITNSERGICICADSNTVVNNTITLCSDRSVWLWGGGNAFRDNRVEKNQWGIIVSNGYDNGIYHNDFIHNRYQVGFVGRIYLNTWDGGYPSGGNHWSDYVGNDTYNGPYQNETGSDRIGDTPYVCYIDNEDRYPIMHPLVTALYSPMAKFTYSLKHPYVNQTVTFNASASSPGWNGTARASTFSYAWDFGDGNMTTVTNSVISHTYVAEGTYTVNLTVTCQDPVLIAEGLASDSTWKSIEIANPPPPYSPTANFDYWTHIPYVNNTLAFYASGSLPGWSGTYDVPVANYTWDFGDGNITTTTNSTIEHIYAHNRTYMVNLTVACQDDSVLIAEGLTSDSTWKNVTVRIETPLPSSTAVVFEDGFEGYDVGTFPYGGGWELWQGGGGRYPDFWKQIEPLQVIVDNSPTKSLNLLGYTSCPYPVATKRINTGAPVIGFEVWVRSRKSGTWEKNYPLTRVGFVKKTAPAEVKWYAKVSFTEDHEIHAGGQLLQSYVLNRWYKVRVVADRPAGTFSVWIDDVLKGENLTASGDLYEIEAFGLTQCFKKFNSYFDEVKIFYPPIYDLAITEVALSSFVVEQGCVVPINVAVANQGDFTERFNVTAYYNSKVIETQPVSLDGGASVIIFFTWYTAEVDKGDYTISAEASALQGETNLADNNKLADSTVTVVVLGHDVAIKDVTSCKTVVGQGYPLFVNLILKNFGSFAETFNITTYYNETNPIATKTITLTSGNSTTITFTWNTTDWAKGVYTISINATIVPGETDTGDNTLAYQVRVNRVGDVVILYGVVDILDIVYVAIHFDAEKGEPEYYPNADINGDGFINILDIVIVGIHFGETDP